MKLPSDLMDCQLNPGADSEAINDLESRLGVELPDDYRRVLSQTNGLEGFIGPDTYFVLWRVEEVAERNTDYGTQEFIPGLVLIGTDGATRGWGFRGEDGEYFAVPLIGMEPEAASFVGDSFESLLVYAKK